MARQRLGQHFLSDPEWREQVARAIRVSPQSIAPHTKGTEEHCWIEIGSGHGEMTEHLVSSGIPVYAIELDARLIAKLRHLAKSHRNLAVVHGDVLDTDIAALAEDKRIRVYGNLPYYITSPILHRLFEFVDAIDEIHIVIQWEVAQRLDAKPETRDYGYLSVLTQYYSRPELVMKIPRGAFSPPPEVDSALVTLRLPGARVNLDIADGEWFLEFVKMCFAHKRKTLVNNVRAIVTPGNLRGTLERLGLRADARAEQLSVEKLAGLFRSLEEARR